MTRCTVKTQRNTVTKEEKMTTNTVTRTRGKGKHDNRSKPTDIATHIQLIPQTMHYMRQLRHWKHVVLFNIDTVAAEGVRTQKQKIAMSRRDNWNKRKTHLNENQRNPTR